MKRFQFRLQSVLDHRQRKETIAQLNLGQAQAQLAAALQAQAEMEEVRDAIIGELSERRLAGDFDPNESRLYHDYLKKINHCLNEQNLYVADLSSTTEALRLNLLGVTQERQVLDHMKAKAQSAHHTEALKTEQSVNDDLASVRRHYQRARAVGE